MLVDELEVGDEVFTIRDGKVKVTAINPSVEYSIKAGGATFTEDGKWYTTDKYPSIWKNIPAGLHATAEPITFEKGDRVLCGTFKSRRYYSHFDERKGLHHCFITVDEWDEGEDTTSWKTVVPYVEGQ